MQVPPHPTLHPTLHPRSLQVAIDFWWIKPKASDKKALEPETLHLQHKPPHKNDPGRSRALYVQFADLFQGPGGSAVGGGKLQFGILMVGGVRRAYIEQLGSGDRYFIYLIWQARQCVSGACHPQRRSGRGAHAEAGEGRE